MCVGPHSIRSAATNMDLPSGDKGGDESGWYLVSDLGWGRAQCALGVGLD
jgi:hypothetical protein